MSLQTIDTYQEFMENSKQDKLNNLVNLVKKEIPNIKKIIEGKNLEIENNDLDLFIKEGLNKIISKIENNEDCKDEYSYFLLEALIKNNKECIIDSLYNPNCSGNYDIFEEIEKIKEEAEKKLKNLQEISKDTNPEFQEIIKTKIKFQNINKKTYFQKYDFFKELSPELQDDLLKKIEGKDKKEVQKIVMELEEIYNEVNFILGKRNLGKGAILLISSIILSTFFEKEEFMILALLAPYFMYRANNPNFKNIKSFSELEEIIKIGDPVDNMENSVKAIPKEIKKYIKGILSAIRV